MGNLGTNRREGQVFGQAVKITVRMLLTVDHHVFKCLADGSSVLEGLAMSPRS